MYKIRVTNCDIDQILMIVTFGNLVGRFKLTLTYWINCLATREILNKKIDLMILVKT